MSTYRRSISLLFFVHGLIVATWVSRIPAIQSRLHLNAGALGLALLGAAVGSLLSLPVAGWLIARFGSKPVTTISSLCFSGAVVLPAAASDGVSLVVALAAYGAAAGAMEVSMNAQGVALERQFGRPVMSSLHALYSVGGMIGAALGALTAARGIKPTPHFLAAAVAFVSLSIVAARHLLPRSVDQAPGPVSFRLTSFVLGLGALAFCFFLGEGAMADWSGIYLRHYLGAGPGTSAAGYGVFSATMALGRLCGDALTGRLGRLFVVRYGSLVAAGGLAMALLVGTTATALAGFALVGAGFSVIVPAVFGAAGRVGGMPAGAALAAVTAAGYSGWLTGPPLIGFTADRLGLRIALLLVVLLSAAGAVLAGVVAPNRRAVAYTRASAA